MGLNISGLIIDKNYTNRISDLESILGEKLIYEKDVIFEEAIESWKEDSYCDIYYSDKGTLVLLSMELGGFEFYAKNQNAFSFVLSEMTMMFSINYVKNGQLIRTIMETEDGIQENEGQPFEFEKNEDDNSEVIYHLFEKTLGESFDDIDLESKCVRYSFQSTGQSEDKEKMNNDKKPWWKIW